MQAVEPPKSKTCISISSVVACTMVLSVGASLLGGLIMYFESLDALHETVSEVSAAETALIATQLNQSFTIPMQLTQQMQKLFVHENVFGNTSYCAANMDECQQEWHEYTKWFEFAMMSNITQEIGVVLPVHGPNAAGLFYSHVWYDVLRHGAREYVHAKYGSYMTDNFNATHDTTQADTFSLATETGRVNTSAGTDPTKPGKLYDFDCSTYNKWEWTTPQEGDQSVTVTRWRAPQVWLSNDNSAYVFMAFDTSWPPPLPPHPWSGFRRVMLHAFLILNRFEDVVAEYAGTHPQTTVVVYDEDTLWVYASSELNHSMVADNCGDNREVEGNKFQECKIFINQNTTQVVNDAHSIMKNEVGGFRKAAAGGNQVFLRKLHLFEEVHKGQVQFSAKILWIRDVSSVSGQVERALTILLVFSAGVFVVDLLLAIVEVSLIARPLARGTELMAHVGNLQLEEARAHFQMETNRFALREVRGLFCSVLQALDTLYEYRTYLPPVLFKTDVDNNSNETAPPVDDCCIVFTDISNSVSLWEASWDGIQDAVEIHNQLMKKLMQAHSGYEVKQMGDAFMIAFQKVTDACSFCLQVQEELLQQTWLQTQQPRTEEQELMGGLTVRMGIHCGQVITQPNPLTEKIDYLGETVEVAAKAWSQALPGMVVATQQVIDNLDEIAKQGIMVKHLTSIAAPRRTELFYILSEKLKRREVVYLKVITKGNPLVLSPDKGDMTGSADSQTDSSWINTVVGGSTQNLLNMKLKTASNAAIAEVSADGTLVGITDTARMFAVLQSVLTVVSEAAILTGGTLVSLSGAESTITWGVGQSCSLVTLKALRYCAMLLTRAGQKNVTIGLSVGQVVHGNVGTSVRRFNTVLGTTALLAKTLVHHAVKVWDVPMLSIMRNRVPTTIEALLRPVDVWGAEGAPPVVVEEVLMEPLFKTLRTDKWETMASDVANDLASTCSDEGKEYRNKFFGAIYGDTDDLMWLREEADDDVTVKKVVEHIKDHILQHPHRRWRLDLPFTLPCLPLGLQECGTVLSEEDIPPHTGHSVSVELGPNTASESSRPPSSRPSSRSSQRISINPIPVVTSL